MTKNFFIVFIIVGSIIVLSALLISIFKRKNVGDLDVTFDHVYNNKNLKQIVTNSAEVGKYNSPFMDDKSMATKIDNGANIINNNGIIFKKDFNYDNKPKW